MLTESRERSMITCVVPFGRNALLLMSRSEIVLVMQTES